MISRDFLFLISKLCHLSEIKIMYIALIEKLILSLYLSQTFQSIYEGNLLMLALTLHFKKNIKNLQLFYFITKLKVRVFILKKSDHIS